MNKAVFFDRDDTIIENVPYNGDPARVNLLPGARRALQRCRDAGFLLFIVSNQSGVGRGYISKDQVHAVNREMIRQLGEHFFKDIYMCYDDPTVQQNGCRKPSPALIEQAAADYDIDLTRSFMVGDADSDIQAGQRAGCRTVRLVQAFSLSSSDSAPSSFTASSLIQTVDWILEQS
ncbi:MAG: HAD family hydrolase [candidate division KSB1 bacterium]|nr:HAD family hydrolase [candidate division KSB1 bacterium]